MRLSLRNRFLVPTLGLIVLGTGILTAASYYKSKDALTTAIHDQINALADSTNNIISSWLHDRQQDVKSWSKQRIYQLAALDSTMGITARSRADAQLADLKKSFPYYEDINLTNADGEVVAASSPGIANKIHVAGRQYFQDAIHGKLAITGVVRSKHTGNPVFMIAAPVRNDGNIVGILFAVVDIAHFSKMFIDPVKLGKRGYAYLVNHKGMVIAYPDKSQILKLDLKSYAWGRQLLAKGNGLMTYTWQGLPRFAALRRNPELNWTLVVSTPTEDVFAPVKSLGYVNLSVAAGIIVLAAVLILLLVRSTVNPINHIISGLGDASEQVATSADQVSASSQQLAEGSSQQAAALEESSSSLEEMTSMTRQNANNAGQANTLMKEAIQVVAAANDSMQQLTTSMHEISQASEETSKIIKTIDEISFQTNLLALNAAVEAARAGEAGAGFAVVADEVRNLALRAAEAARNTATLIEGTVKKVHEGDELVVRTNTAFSEVAKTSGKVDELVSEIAAASQEQAQGIEQVNKAVAEMDKVTQQTAAIGEESSAAAVEMNTQAKEMKSFVSQLIHIVGANGNGNGSGNGKTTFEELRKPVQNQTARTPRSQDKQLAYEHKAEPQQVIPLDEDDFADF